WEKESEEVKTEYKRISKEAHLKKKAIRKNTFNSDEEEEEDYDNDDSGSYVLKSWNSKKRARSYQESVRIDFEVVEQDDENPLPGFIDPITLEEVNRPAISPYGHVMG
ncbi:11142_t:CDS:2, partial [Entrophospora sp. SA101]